MQLHQIRAFVEVATRRHFGRAAEALHVSQPALSQRIHCLEGELSLALFIRTSRTVELTEGGEALLPFARRLIADEDRAIAAMRTLAAGASGHIRIAYWMPGDPKLQTRVAKVLAALAPGVRIEACFGYSVPNLQQLRSGEVDLAFINLPMYDLDEIAVTVVETEPFLLVLPADHPLAGSLEVGLDKMAGERWILFPRPLNPGQYDYIVESIRKATGEEPSMALEALAQGYEANVEAVAAGIGIALCAMSRTRQLRIDGVRYIPLTSNHPIWQLGLIAAEPTQGRPVGRLVQAVVDDFRREGACVLSAPERGSGSTLIAT